MKKFILAFLLFSCASEESRLADSYYQNKNYRKAIEYYSESLKLKPNDTQSLYRRGRSYEEISDMQIKITPRLFNIPTTMKLQNIKSIHLESFIQIKATVVRATDIRPKVLSMNFVCNKCGEILEEIFEDGSIQKTNTLLLSLEYIISLK